MQDPIKSGLGRPAPKHDETFKRHAVELSLRGDRTSKQIAAELGISGWTLCQWRKLYGPSVRGTGSVPQTMEEKDEEIRQLRAEVVRMREREIVLKNRWASSPKRPGAVCSGQGDEGRTRRGRALRGAGGEPIGLLPLADGEALRAQPTRRGAGGAGGGGASPFPGQLRGAPDPGRTAGGRGPDQ